MNPLFPLLFQYNRNLVYALNEALKPHHLYSAQWSIIYILQKEGPQSLTMLWKTLKVEAPTVTRTINRLEKLGFVQRHEGKDKREKIVSLTPYAVSIYPKIEKSVMQFEEQMSSNLTEKEQRQLIDLLEKMKG